MIPVKKVEQLIDKHQFLEKELSQGNISKKDFAIKSKEYSSRGEIVQSAREYLKFEDQKKELDKIVNEQNADKEMKELAQKELKQLVESKNKNEKDYKKYYTHPVLVNELVDSQQNPGRQGQSYARTGKQG